MDTDPYPETVCTRCPERSLDVLAAIDDLSTRGQPPSVRELVKATGTTAVPRHLDILERHGFITRGPVRISRTIAMTRLGRRIVDEHLARRAA